MGGENERVRPLPLSLARGDPAARATIGYRRLPWTALVRTSPLPKGGYLHFLQLKTGIAMIILH
ncbi:hypothetical protein RAC89_08415 [Paenibacillus sp. GD4]|uniref:hypothetical protein n=1 Tax=Paenibacillus sp. GD4 TaxID=3068890 RepID=UPI0027969097|nr:hypothetical protein [Paenibacillus sp. GD4]MDQ1910522.1 hypothetical protein [Paenibacillus sp. GD4]